MQAYRSALVTGASSGIGEAFARELAARGAHLVIVARRTDRLERLAAELRERYRVDVEVHTVDLTEPDQRSTVEERLADPARPIELLVNNAGFGTSGSFAELPLSREEREINLNVLSLVRLTHAALPSMIERRHGGVLNVSSMAGFLAAPFSATYCATKSYVTAFSESLHGEVAPQGVHVTALCPGFVRTEFETRAESVPGFAWVPIESVVREGLAAVSSGRTMCVPGAQYKAAAPVIRIAPRRLLRTVVSRVWL
ncbi:MAG: SDR family NAD(P)-dependent oxidoreductase [Streptosporangiales bacterium]|nr:SDR family NAD(P)-dependent oxidoreductase [Streptosporangiales bacterium]